MSAAIARLVSTYSHAYQAALLVALACSVVGVWVVLRRVAFVGIATAQVAGAGVSLAFLLGFAPLPASVVSALLGVLLFAFAREPARAPRDAIVGVAFAVSSALAVLFVARSSAELDQVEHIIYGSLLFTTGAQVKLLAAGTAAVVALNAAFAKEFAMISFDSDTAETLGVRTGAFTALLFLCIGAVIALAISVAGSLVTFAFLILPPLNGLLLSDRLGRVFQVSIATALASALGGVLVSIAFDFPTGPAIVVCAGAVTGLAAIAAVSRLGGALAAAAALALAVWLVPGRGEPPAAGAPATESREDWHVDLELAVHDKTVRRGERLHVDYVVRLRGRAPANLHLALDLGTALGVAPLAGVTARSAGRIEIETGELEPGSYEVTASLWTGSPLEPDAETELLPPDMCTAAALRVEVR